MNILPCFILVSRTHHRCIRIKWNKADRFEQDQIISNTKWYFDSFILTIGSWGQRKHLQLPATGKERSKAVWFQDAKYDKRIILSHSSNNSNLQQYTRRNWRRQNRKRVHLLIKRGYAIWNHQHIHEMYSIITSYYDDM